MKPETIALHHGYSPDSQNAVAVPIHQTTSFSFDNAQHAADLFDLKVEGNIYSRIMNPTCAVLEQRVAALEGGIAGLAVASGMAAITYAIQTIAEAGDNTTATPFLCRPIEHGADIVVHSATKYIGDAKSCSSIPASTTHRQLNEQELNAAGVTPDMVRLSIGIEHIDDLLADIDQALAASQR